MKLNKKKKGFTLIELMAVIAIVAILAAVLVPTVNGYITRAKKIAVITQVREAVNAIEVNNTTDPTPIAEDTATSGSLKTAIESLPTDMQPKDLTKLGTMSVKQAFDINKDSNAAAGITLENGVFSSYTAVK